MLKPIEINFKLDKTIKPALATELMIKSHDVDVIEFHISFDGLELTADHTVKVLSVFNGTESQTNVNCDIVDGKSIYRPDTSIISQNEYVQNYVYVYHGEQSLDVRLFIYRVGLSEIDKAALKVKTVYDQSYADLLADFEQALQDYKDSLPQVSELRVEIDEVLDKFKTDSRAKLDVIEAAEEIRQTAESARQEAESSRQESFESKETARQEIFNQAENARQEAEAERVEAEVVRRTTFDTNETARQSAYITAENTRDQSYSVAESSRDDIFQQAEINRSQQTTVANLKDGSYLKYWAGSQVEYDAIGTYDLDTIYDIWG